MLSTDSTSDDAAPEDLESDKYTSSNTRSENGRFIRIKDDADLVLDVEISSGGEHILYLVTTTELRDSSSYFRNLLDPEKFSEGVRVSAVQRMLRGQYRSWEDVPPNELPGISITDIGQLSSRVRHEGSMTTFLRILHGVHFQADQPTPSRLANLVVLADRFDGLKSIRDFVGKHYGLYNAITTKWLNSTYKEESRDWSTMGPGAGTLYQRMLMENRGRFGGHYLTGLKELIQRRESILNTLNEIQGYFLKVYTSKQRQCKLGYDSSAQCDSFQLGEMVRFFTRVGTLRLQGMIYDDGDPQFFVGSLDKLLEKLRQCPSYQINKHHSHCGLRARLLPVIEVIQGLLESEAGICGKCWVTGKTGLMWSQLPRVKYWAYMPSKVLCKNKCERHDQAREMFTAQERDWGPH